MTIENLEAEVMALPKDSQAILLSRLLKHLGQISEIDPEAASLWGEEAQRRDREMDGGQVTGIPAEQVFEKIRGFLQLKTMLVINYNNIKSLLT